MYLWQLDVNKYEAVTQVGCAWDFYAGGWVLDTIPRAAPTGLLFVKNTSNSVSLSWSVPTSGIAPIGHVIERNNVKIGETESTAYTDSLLAENTECNYTVYGRTNGIVYSSPLSGGYSTVANETPASIVSFRPALYVSPMPFASQVNISYSLPVKGQVRVAIYNVQGQMVALVSNRVQDKGTYQLHWKGIDSNGKSLTNGIYLCRLFLDNRMEKTERLVLVR